MNIYERSWRAGKIDNQEKEENFPPLTVDF